MSALPWDDFLPEMKQEVRSRLDLLTGRLLAYTCKAERKALLSTRPDRQYCMEALFQHAAKAGYVAICQWIFDVTAHWTEQHALPYHVDLDVGKALKYGQTHILDWAIERGLPRADYVIYHRNLGRNNLASLKWLIAHGHPMPRHIGLDITNMDVIRWLLAQQPSVTPDEEAVRHAFLNLPRDGERLLFFLAQAGSTLPFGLVFLAINMRRWDAIAFVEQHMPAVIEAIGAKWPEVGSIIANRSPVGFINPDGTVVHETRMQTLLRELTVIHY